jgi:hypothetical protein
MWVKGLWALVTVALVASSAWAADVAVPAKEPAKTESKAESPLPDAAAKAVAEAFPKATVLQWDVQKGPGMDLYHVALKDEKGKEIHIGVASEGTIIGFKMRVTEKDLPAAVAKAFKDAKANLARIDRTETRAELSVVDGKAKIVKFEKARVVYTAGDQIVNEDGTAPGAKAAEKAPEAPKPPAAPKTEK